MTLTTVIKPLLPNFLGRVIVILNFVNFADSRGIGDLSAGIYLPMSPGSAADEPEVLFPAKMYSCTRCARIHVQFI